MSEHREYRGVAGQIADSMKDDIGEVAAQAAKTAVDANLDRVAAEVEKRYGAVLDPAAEMADQVSRSVRERPMAWVFGAAMVGFLIGYIRGD